MLQVKQEVGELSQAGRRDKRQVQKLQLELLQAKQLLEKLRSDKQVVSISLKAVLRVLKHFHSIVGSTDELSSI